MMIMMPITINNFLSNNQYKAHMPKPKDIIVIYENHLQNRKTKATFGWCMQGRVEFAKIKKIE